MRAVRAKKGGRMKLLMRCSTRMTLDLPAKPYDDMTALRVRVSPSRPQECRRVRADDWARATDDTAGERGPTDQAVTLRSPPISVSGALPHLRSRHEPDEGAVPSTPRFLDPVMLADIFVAPEGHNLPLVPTAGTVMLSSFIRLALRSSARHNSYRRAISLDSSARHVSHTITTAPFRRGQTR